MYSERTPCWVVRDRAMRRFRVFIKLGGRSFLGHTRKSTLYLPLLRMGENLYATSTFGAWELDWWAIHYDGHVSAMSFMMDDITTGSFPYEIQDSFVAPKNEPRVCMVAVDKGDPEVGLRPIGIEKMKADRVRSGILFKKDAPDKSMQVDFTPAVDGSPYLQVHKPEPHQEMIIEDGDYILTENGFFVGVMVSRDSCYVVPAELPPPDAAVEIPLTKPSDAEFYDAFTESAGRVRSMIRE